AGVAAGHANLDVAGRELLPQLERGLAEDVEQPDLDRRLEWSPETFEGRSRGLVGARERLQVAEDRVQVRPQVHQRPSCVAVPPWWRRCDVTMTSSCRRCQPPR